MKNSHKYKIVINVSIKLQPRTAGGCISSVPILNAGRKYEGDVLPPLW